MAPWRSIFACTKPLWAHSTTSFLSAFWETGRSKNARTTRRGKKYTAEYFYQFSSTLTSVELVISPFYRYSHPKLSSRFFHPDRPCGLHSVYPKRLDSPASRADSAFLEHTALNLSPSVNVPAPLWKKAVNKKGS
ncbi:hypothetical protein TMatcc_006068 [Talaromyces marneffei ATCC 18224]